MAELRRNQRGEIGRQHVKAHSCSHFSPCFDHTSPTQIDDGTIQIDHAIGAFLKTHLKCTYSCVCFHTVIPKSTGRELSPQCHSVSSHKATSNSHHYSNTVVQWQSAINDVFGDHAVHSVDAGKREKSKRRKTTVEYQSGSCRMQKRGQASN